MSTKRILVVGSIAIDWLELPDGRKGEVIGGSATYFTRTAGRFAPVHVVGIVGSDFPTKGTEILKEYAANLDDLQVVAGKTFRWGGRYHGDWERRTTLFTELGVFETFQPILSEENRSCPLVYLGNIQPSLQLDVLRQIRTPASRIISDTMNLWIQTAREDLAKVLEQTDILLVNQTEASMLAEIPDLAEAANRIREMGPETVVVKQGHLGAFLVNNSGISRVNVFPVERVVDPTGAGDSFAGGFVVALSRGKSLVEALVTGSATASFCVEGFGLEGLERLSEDNLQYRMNVIYTKSELP